MNMFKLSFKNAVSWGIIGVIFYQLSFVWIPLWRSSHALEGVDISQVVLEKMNGEFVKIKHFKGRKVILNFWASWCLPCRLELPLLSKTYSGLIEDGKLLFAVNSNESWQKIREFEKKSPIGFPVLKDHGILARKLNIRLIPSIVVVGKDGKVESITYGFRPWIQLYLKWWV
ncbi:MAG: thiol-disulfide isomerase/thioredoxin [bacterium]|jgi:thiol-disulfide isomerase/thioredoxin